MTTKYEQVANQMMRGFNSKKTLKNKDQMNFRSRFSPLIKWIAENLPTGMGAGIGAAVGKCFLWMEEKEIVMKFLKKLKETDFDGKTDPAHVYWLFWSINVSKVKTDQLYKKGMYAIKKFAKGRKIEHDLRAEKQDLFEWDKEFKTMVRVMPDSNGGLTYEVKVPPTVDQIEKIIDLFENGPKSQIIPNDIKFGT